MTRKNMMKRVTTESMRMMELRKKLFVGDRIAAVDMRALTERRCSLESGNDPIMTGITTATLIVLKKLWTQHTETMNCMPCLLTATTC